ncbi:MAG TPA: hypothetical protein VLG39_06000, partial [Nitrospirota bacterium]|nr:hypothetical protein [Nitrospirota bacterium]
FSQTAVFLPNFLIFRSRNGRIERDRSKLILFLYCRVVKLVIYLKKKGKCPLWIMNGLTKEGGTEK